MIHFFRKIRAELLKESSFSKYLIYAIGEIFLVMIGIMLALYFNNLNSEIENESKERWYLINIVEDIEYQKVILKDMKEYCEESISTSKTIIKDFHKKQGFVKIDSLNEKLNSLVETYSFPNTNNAYTELVSSGKLSLIKNKDLSIDIINYYLTSQGSYNNVKNDIDNIFYPEVYPVLKRLCQIELYDEDVEAGEEFLLEQNKDLSLLINKNLENPSTKLDLLNSIKIKIQILNYHLYMVEDILELAKELITSIDKDLGLTSDMVNHYD